MAWVVEMTGFDLVAEAEKTVRFAMGEGIAFTDAAYAVGALMSWSSPSQRIDIGATGMVEVRADSGDIVIANYPDTADSPGPIDELAKWSWSNRPAALYWVPAKLWADRTLLASGTMIQPVSSSGASVLTFQLRDPRADLDTPLQTSTFAGTNEGPDGVEGDENLKGRVKPIVYGLVSNISPPLVNESLLIYQISDKLCSVLCVRDGGVSLAQGTFRANIASMQATEPSGGFYDICRTATGTYIRLGSSPIYDITVDADEAELEDDQSHARIWSRIRSQRIGSTVDAASVAAAHAIDPHGAGFYWDEPISQHDALNEVLGSFSGYELLSGDVWKVGKIVLPTGSPVLELLPLRPNARMKTISRALSSMNYIRPAFAPLGSPPYRITVNWGRNYTVMNGSDFAGSAPRRLIEKFSTEYRTAVSEDLGVWNPTTKTGPWRNAPELTINSAYQPGDDGLSSPGAANEAARLMDLLGPMRAHYQVEYTPKIGDLLEPGNVVRLFSPRMDLEAGGLFLVLMARLSVRNGKASAGLVLGLQA